MTRQRTRPRQFTAAQLIIALLALTCGVRQLPAQDASRREPPPRVADNSRSNLFFTEGVRARGGSVEVRQSVRNDVSPRLASLGRMSNALRTQDESQKAERQFFVDDGSEPEAPAQALAPPQLEESSAQSTQAASDGAGPVPAAGRAVEQTSQGARAPALLTESFDGLGVGFEGPQGKTNLRNPSDNSLAVGPDHIVQTVNTRMAVFTKKGQRFDTTGRVLYGPVVNNAVFKGFGGQCEARNNGDTVVRYDQLAHRWLIVMPLFVRGPVRADQPKPGQSGEPAEASVPGHPSQPGPPYQLTPLPQPGPSPSPSPRPGQQTPRAEGPQGPYSMCYAVSTTADPLGQYYRYEFLRPLFPDYPRPAVWPDGYYIPTSTGDEVIQKHACVAERAKMLKGQPAREQCVIIDGVNFLNNADLDGQGLPPRGAPNIIMAAGGTQLKKVLEDDVISAWKFHVDWETPAKTKLTGPMKIAVAPYQYLCGGQLTNCVPQPGTDRKLDAQGDKIMARLVYRKVNGHESIVAIHSVNTNAGGGGVRWYEFRLDKKGDPQLYQQGTYAPDNFYRWMGSPAIDRKGNIGIGYSFGGTPHFAGQRFAARLADDPLGQLTLRETVLVEGEAAQNAMRWEDYTQTALDPSDDCIIWYVGDYIKKDAASYSTRIGALRLPGCGALAVRAASGSERARRLQNADFGLRIERENSSSIRNQQMGRPARYRSPL